MATSTSPDSIHAPSITDAYAPVQDMNAQATSVQLALVKRANAYRGTGVQRTAILSEAEDGALFQDTDGEELLWRKKGAAWVRVVPEAQPVPKILTGRAAFTSVTPDVAMSQVITFPAGFFTAAPQVFLTGNTGIASTSSMHYWVSGTPTLTSATISLVKSTSTSQGIFWMAVQPIQ